jgi:hypothetical protein
MYDCSTVVFGVETGTNHVSFFVCTLYTHVRAACVVVWVWGSNASWLFHDWINIFFFFKAKKVESKKLTTPKYIKIREDVQKWRGLGQNSN